MINTYEVSFLSWDCCYSYYVHTHTHATHTLLTHTHFHTHTNIQVQGGVPEWDFDGDRDDCTQDSNTPIQPWLISERNGHRVLTKVREKSV